MDKILRTITRLAVAIALTAMIFQTGCSTPWKTPKMLSLDNTWPFRDKDKPHEGTPVRMVCTWTDTVFTQAGQKPQRGFGGRLMFYEKEGKNPILVEGQLVVYAFDETGRDPTDNKPTRRYVFPPDQIPLHMSKSELGASYSVWLPWDEVGGPKTEVSLICRFEPKTGAVVTSEQTKQKLPGAAPAATAAGVRQPPKLPTGVPSKPARQTLESLQTSRTAEQQARLVSYEAPIAGDQQVLASGVSPQTVAPPERRLTATTITLPPDFQMPEATALNMAAPPAQPFSPNASQTQLRTTPTRTYVPAAAQLPPNFMTQPATGLPPAQPQPLISQALMLPNGQPTSLPPNALVAQAVGQRPVQQFPQGMNQQVPIPGQMTQQLMPGQQPWQQTPVSPGTAAAVNFPPAGQQYR